MKDTAKTFSWIVNLLKEKNIPFVIDGGLAAEAYGSPRELADIDIVVPDKSIYELEPLVRELVVFGPDRYKDESWDVLLMTLDQEGQLVDLSGAESSNIFNKEKEQWVSNPTDLTKFQEKEIFGIKVPLIPKEDLIKEKTELDRFVDEEDVAAIA